MKKLYLLILLLFISCGNSTTADSNSFRRVMGIDYAREFKYKEHDYIYFGGFERAAVVHNPECTNFNCVKIRKKLLSLK